MKFVVESSEKVEIPGNCSELIYDPQLLSEVFQRLNIDVENSLKTARDFILDKIDAEYFISDDIYQFLYIVYVSDFQRFMDYFHNKLLGSNEYELWNIFQQLSKLIDPSYMVRFAKVVSTKNFIKLNEFNVKHVLDDKSKQSFYKIYWGDEEVGYTTLDPETIIVTNKKYYKLVRERLSIKFPIHPWIQE